MTHGSGRAERHEWMDDNTRGLSLAAAAEWDEAAEAFAAAADVLARRPPDPTSHDALGLILSNLAQACFRAGRTPEALAHAQRACAIRMALAGEDSMPVSRARMDLAVMLGSLGRLDEAHALVQRAIAAVEGHVGDEDVRLVTMLENAARLALAAGAPAKAEPVLLRLHALLDVHGMPTARADHLLAVVAQLRAGAEVAPVATHTPVAMDMVELLPVEASFDEWDDEPLRDAVAMTDLLLRRTPAGVIAIPELAPRDADLVAAFERVVLTPLEPLEDLIDEPVSAPMGIVLELTDDFDMVDVPGDAASVSEHTRARAPWADVGGADAPGAEMPAADAQPADAMSFEFDDAFDDALRPAVRHEEPSAPDVIAPTPAPPVRATTDGAPSRAAVQPTGEARPSAPRPRTPPVDRRSRRPRAAPPGISVARIATAVAVAVAAGAVAWYFLLR